MESLEYYGNIVFCAVPYSILTSSDDVKTILNKHRTFVFCFSNNLRLTKGKPKLCFVKYNESEERYAYSISYKPNKTESDSIT